MSKHYKFQNSTVMYLNSSFNCIKSNSINLTTKTAGTGYTSAPTIKITPVANDNRYCATATCTVCRLLRLRILILLRRLLLLLVLLLLLLLSTQTCSAVPPRHQEIWNRWCYLVVRGCPRNASFQPW